MRRVLGVFVFILCFLFICGHAFCDDNTTGLVQEGIGAIGGFLKNKSKSKGNEQKDIAQSNPEDVLQKGDASKISDDGVFYPVGDMAVAKENTETFKVFDIPLNASVQDVFSALEKKGIEFKGGVSQEKEIQARIRDDISRFYESKGITGEREKAALQVMDEGKFNLYSFQYGGQKYWLYPQSLDFLMKSDLEPVFDKYYHIYNSQFAIELRSLSQDMKSQGVIRVYILFGKVGQEEPKSYLISLLFGQKANPKLAAALNKKYGLPKAYRVDTNENRIDDHPQPKQVVPKLADLFTYLKSKSKSFEIRAPNEIINKIGEHLLINDGLALNQIRSPFYFTYDENLFSMYNQGSYYMPYIFEWDSNALKIIATFQNFAFVTMDANNVLLEESPVPLILDPGVVDYIYLPIATQIADGIEETINASKQLSGSLKNKAEEGF
jgi:hypothetical protein